MSPEEDLLRPLIKIALQKVLEAEMNNAVGAAKSERSSERLSHGAAITGASECRAWGR
jgi:transposase-like protein